MAPAAKQKKSRPKVKLSDKAQSEQFVEAARQLGIEETGDSFERSFDKVVSAQKSKRDQPENR